MNPGLALASPVWFVSNDKKLLANLKQNTIDRLAPDVEPLTFVKAGDAADTIQLPEERTSPRPWLVVIDGIGVDPLRSGPSFVEIAREASPLSMILLHSRRTPLDRVRELERQRLIHREVPKGDPEELLEVIAKWWERWNQPTARQMREYIAASPAPDVRYFPAGKGEYLSVIDLHGEIVLGSDLGREAEHVWRKLLAEREMAGIASSSVGAVT